MKLTPNGTKKPREKKGEVEEEENRQNEGEVPEVEEGYDAAMRAKEVPKWSADGWARVGTTIRQGKMDR